MQQRRFRPGDVLDDYCPRERRLTDHAIVAMIDERIKRTRCVVCDAEHEYKEGRVPPQRRGKGSTTLYSQVLDGLQGPLPPARPVPVEVDGPTPDAPATVDPPSTSASTHVAPADPGPTLADTAVAAAASSDVRDTAELPDRPDEGPVRRSLIRATLPRPEGQAPSTPRAMPEFTIRQQHSQQPRGGHRQRRPGQAPGADGHGGSRFGRSGGAHDHGGHGSRSHSHRSQAGGGNRAGGPRRRGKKR